MQQNKDGERKQYKQFGLFNLIILLLTTALYAGSFEEFKKNQNSAFTEFRDKNDRAFNSYLKAQWEEYTAQESAPLYQRQKPKNITPSLEKEIKSVGPRVNIKLPKELKIPKSIPKIASKNEENSKDLSFVFFGQNVGFAIDSSIKDAQFYPQNQSGIANFFARMAASDYEETLRNIQTLSKKLQLNDWGVYQLVLQLSNTLYTHPDSQKLFAWFFFNKLGYEVKIGLANKHVVLMHASKKIIYATPNYSFTGKKFYVISYYAKGSTGKLYTYKQNYPGATKTLDLSLATLPHFIKNEQKKTLSFRQFGKKYSTSFSYDKNLIDFMASYPQADYETYFNAPISEEVYVQIAADIKKYIDNKHSSTAINFVLNFVQKAFKYERDQQQFGREKVMFANETLYYDKSDCEDRAILFATLVKKLFGISVIGVKYKDHMATALYIPLKGDSVKAGNRKFIIADPTYVNANIGQSMPKYKSVIPQSYIVIKKSNS